MTTAFASLPSLKRVREAYRATGLIPAARRTVTAPARGDAVGWGCPLAAVYLDRHPSDLTRLRRPTTKLCAAVRSRVCEWATRTFGYEATAAYMDGFDDRSASPRIEHNRGYARGQRARVALGLNARQ